MSYSEKLHVYEYVVDGKDNKSSNYSLVLREKESDVEVKVPVTSSLYRKASLGDTVKRKSVIEIISKKHDEEVGN